MSENNKEEPLLHAPEGERFLTQEEFENEFLPTQLPNGDLLEWEHVRNTPAENVWTIVDVPGVDEDGNEDNNLYALPGFHKINKIGYVTSVFPWTDQRIAEAIFFDAEDYEFDKEDDE